MSHRWINEEVEGDDVLLLNPFNTSALLGESGGKTLSKLSSSMSPADTTQSHPNTQNSSATPAVSFNSKTTTTTTTNATTATTTMASSTSFNVDNGLLGSVCQTLIQRRLVLSKTVDQFLLDPVVSDTKTVDAKLQSSNRLVTAKIRLNSKDLNNETKLSIGKQLEEEIVLLRQLENSNILSFVNVVCGQLAGTDSCDSTVWLVTERIDANLETLIGRDLLAEPHIAAVARNVSKALLFLHEHVQHIHCDVCPENIVVTHGGVAKLASFEQSVAFGAAGSGSGVAEARHWRYAAPELMSGRQAVGARGDVWALGACVWAAQAGRAPLAEASSRAAAAALMARWNDATLTQCWCVPPPASPLLSAFVAATLRLSPAARPTSRALTRHPFVRTAAPPAALATLLHQ